MIYVQLNVCLVKKIKKTRKTLDLYHILLYVREA